MNENINYTGMSYNDRVKLVINKIENEIKQMKEEIKDDNLVDLFYKNHSILDTNIDREEVLDKIMFGIQLAKYIRVITNSNETIKNLYEMDSIVETLYKNYKYSRDFVETEQAIIVSLRDAMYKSDITSHF